MDWESNKLMRATRLIVGAASAVVMFFFGVLSLLEYRGEALDWMALMPVAAMLLGVLLLADAAAVCSKRFEELRSQLWCSKTALPVVGIILLVLSFPVCGMAMFLTLIPAIGKLACVILGTTPDKLGANIGLVVVGIPVLLSVLALSDIIYQIYIRGKAIKNREK